MPPLVTASTTPSGRKRTGSRSSGWWGSPGRVVSIGQSKRSGPAVPRHGRDARGPPSVFQGNNDQSVEVLGWLFADALGTALQLFHCSPYQHGSRALTVRSHRTVVLYPVLSTRSNPKKRPPCWCAPAGQAAAPQTPMPRLCGAHAAAARSDESATALARPLPEHLWAPHTAPPTRA